MFNQFLRITICLLLFTYFNMREFLFSVVLYHMAMYVICCLIMRAHHRMRKICSRLLTYVAYVAAYGLFTLLRLQDGELGDARVHYEVEFFVAARVVVAIVHIAIFPLQKCSN